MTGRFRAAVAGWSQALVLAGLMSAGGLVPRPALAGGITLFELGLQDNGMATAGRYVLATDPSTAGTNPAGMTRLDGSQYMVASTPLAADVEYELGALTSVPGGGGNGGSAGGVIPTASFFMTRELGKTARFGFGFYGGAGLGADYDDDWAGRYYVTEAELSILLINPTVAWKASDKVSIGGGLMFGWGDLLLEAAVNNDFGATAGDPDGRLEAEDQTLAFGASLGLMVEASERTRFGLTYYSQLDFEFEDALGFSGVTNPLLQALIAPLATSEVDLELHLPQSVFLSWYTDVTDGFALAGNLGWQEWSEFGYVDVTISDPNIPDATSDLQFVNTWHAALGAMFKTSDTMTWSTGLAYDQSPGTRDNRSIVFPLDQQTRISGGFQRKLVTGNEWGLNLTYVDLGSAKSDEMRGVLAGRVQGEYDTNFMVSLGFNWIWR